MNLDRFLNLLAAVFGAIGSVYVLKGIVSLTPMLIARLSSTDWGFSETQIDALVSQKADGIVGMALVVIAFLLAAVALIVVPDGTRVFSKLWVALAVVVAFAGTSYFALRAIGSVIQRHQKHEVARLFASGALGEVFHRKHAEIWDTGDLPVYARLIGLQVDESEPLRSLVAKMATALDMQVPEDFDFSKVEKQ
jgi:hypothetical protein